MTNLSLSKTLTKGPVFLCGTGRNVKETDKQLSDMEVYQELNGDLEAPFIKVMKAILKNVRNRRNISDEILDYFLINDPKIGRFGILQKIHKRLDNVSGRPVISSLGYFTENISVFIDYHLESLT